MTYQDQKIGVIARMTLLATALAVLLAITLIYPDRTRSFVVHLPLSRHDDCGIWLGVLTVLAPLCWIVTLALIFTSPEQEVRFVRWSKRFRRTPIKFEEIQFDTLDPAYRTATWRYFVDRRRR